MFRLKNYALLATLVCGVAYSSRCQAQTLCLQYPLYWDGDVTYLFVADEYDNNNPPTCGNFDGEVYVWETVTSSFPANPAPEACGQCIDGRDATLPGTDGKDAKLYAQGDKPFPKPLPNYAYTIGYTIGGDVIKKSKGSKCTNPTAGIKMLASPSSKSGQVIWVTTQTAASPKSIPILLFDVTLDYGLGGAAGTVPAPRGIYVGFEIDPNGAPTSTPLTLDSKHRNRTFSGRVKVTGSAGEDTKTYHIVTNTPLFDPS